MKYKNEPLSLDEMFAECSGRVEFMRYAVERPDFDNDKNMERYRQARNKRQKFRRYRDKLNQLDKLYNDESSEKKKKDIFKEIIKCEEKCTHAAYEAGMSYRNFLLDA